MSGVVFAFEHFDNTSAFWCDFCDQVLHCNVLQAFFSDHIWTQEYMRLQMLFHGTTTHIRAHIITYNTFAVCFQLILPSTLHQFCPEHLFQPAATHLVDIM